MGDFEGLRFLVVRIRIGLNVSVLGLLYKLVDLIDYKKVNVRKFMFRFFFMEKSVVCFKVNGYGDGKSEIIIKVKLVSVFFFFRKVFIVVGLELGMNKIFKKVDIVVILSFNRGIDSYFKRFLCNGGFFIDCLKIIEEGKFRNIKLFGGVIIVELKDGVRKLM